VGARWTNVLLWCVGGIVVLAALAAGIYAFINRDVFKPREAVVATTTEGDPTQIGRMVLKAQYTGPLKDTIVQRWEDPATGNTCYIYLPVVVQHSPPTPTGFVQYGANGIGSISCVK